MPFNGSGSFQPLPPPTFPPVSGNVISSAYFIANLTDIFTGLSNCITRDGQSPATANLPMGAHKLTGLTAGATAGDSVEYSQLASTNAAVAAETTRATGAEATLQSNIDAEAARALAAETVLSGTISSETTARIAGDAATLASAEAYADALSLLPKAVASGSISAGVLTANFTGGNVASFTRISAGLYRLTFAVARPNTNYAVLCSCLDTTNLSSSYAIKGTAGVDILTVAPATSTPGDATDVTIAVIY